MARTPSKPRARFIALILMLFSMGIACGAPPEPLIDGLGTILVEEGPGLPPGVVVLPVKELREAVRTSAGARPWDGDAVDARIVEAVVSRGGRIIDSQDQVGGYPVQEPTESPFRVEEWELETMSRS